MGWQAFTTRPGQKRARSSLNLSSKRWIRNCKHQKLSMISTQTMSSVKNLVPISILVLAKKTEMKKVKVRSCPRMTRRKALSLHKGGPVPHAQGMLKILDSMEKGELLDKELATSQSLQPQNQSDKTENGFASNIQTTKQSKLTDYFKK